VCPFLSPPSSRLRTPWKFETNISYSGLVEATLDRKLIRKILKELKSEEAVLDERKAEDKTDAKTKFQKKIHQLYIILVGNLELDPEKDIDNPHVPTVWNDVKELTTPESDSRMDGQGDAHFKSVTNARLKAMLASQTSFGVAVGAPIVFFVGSFLFSVISNFGTLGDNDTSHALAFGEWWMIIPHVTIVSGCLLAGNNPNTLQSIVFSLKGPWPNEPIQNTTRLVKFGQPYYRSVYRPVNMWQRGLSKRMWIANLTKTYDLKTEPEDNYREAHITFRDLVALVFITLVLIVFPFVLAFLTSYFTPTVGMSCRTFTFLIYFISQFILSAVWMFDFFENHKKKMDVKTEVRKSPVLLRLFLALGLLGSVFTAVVGTFLQILGVYRNCLCTLPISAWRSRNFSVVVSSNSADDIKYASKFWVPTGVASIVLMIVVCYFGWWYQRYWSTQFKSAIDKLLPLPLPLTGVVDNGNNGVAENKRADDGAGGAPGASNATTMGEKSLKEPMTSEIEVGEEKNEENGEDKIEKHPEVKG